MTWVLLASVGRVGRVGRVGISFVSLVSMETQRGLGKGKICGA